MGLRDPGELTLTMQHSVTDAGQLALRTDAGTRTQRKMAIKWTTVDANGLGVEFNAYCGGVAIDGSPDDKVMASGQIIIANAVTETTFAT